ncbi:hypothetical protein ARC78_04890 [Stenotrophomonas pictorum JCM 9942]|jgi:uncharacterized membrane protein (DUF485 family)|uniref:DUF485 domain-containing protein n=1 Tax=Stenotrophomonas pictorum JCM 9942 TaxID=1236960 RepID=A0A0R0AR94_9GAMM|nr:DUF485 domain-containing protein [Stenotrophomonas pictorum]KRG44490.1 hypothetical protein ARC78_04890 [Stenotrophomonas pictorum JCM 9942]
MTASADPRVERIASNPKYQRLRSTRNKLGWTLTIVMLLAYYGYIGLIAFDKAFLATPIGAGKITTVGIPIALGLMVFTILITGFYVRRANREFDKLTEQIMEEAQ